MSSPSAHASIPSHQLSRDGLSQEGRAPASLDPTSAPIDARSAEDLLRWARAFAPLVKHFDSSATVATTTWRRHFEPIEGMTDRELLAHEAGHVPPHLGLYLAFLELCRHPQSIINRITADHLRLQLERVLGFRRRPKRPDRVHLIAELKRGVDPLIVGGAHRFVAGKDAEGVELVYRPVRDAYVGRATVQQVCSIARVGDSLRFAPVAMSADGLGAPLPSEDPSWPAFGRGEHPVARPGFAIASPTLRLASGTRTITVRCRAAAGDSPLTEADVNRFDAYLTSPKGWIGPLTITGVVAGSELTFSLTLTPSDPPVSDYDQAIHGQRYETTSPILHLQLRETDLATYSALASVALTSITLDVDAKEVAGLVLETDEATLNPKKAFMPFGAQPAAGATLFVGFAEAFSKNVTDLTVQITWKGAPTDLSAHYSGYPSHDLVRGGVPVTMTFVDQTGTRSVAVARIDPSAEAGVTELKPLVDGAARGAAFATWMPDSLRSMARMAAYHAGGAVGRAQWLRSARANPIEQASTPPPPTPPAGTLAIRLDGDFLHQEFRSESLRRALRAAGRRKPARSLTEPYTPLASAIRLDYSATSGEVSLADESERCFTHAEASFFHVDCFGQRREHPHLRALAREAMGPLAPPAKAVPLLPSHVDAGECFIGLGGVGGGEAVHMLVKVAEGSADPSLEPQPLAWSVLCDNDWMPLGEESITIDESRDFRTSGIIAITIPRLATLEHTVMPTGLLWLRATIARSADAACRLVAIHPNAIEVALADDRDDPAHLSTPLPAGAITKARPPIAGIKSVQQPYPSVDGKRRETSEALRVRASERLRHRGRAILPSDFEHLVLEAFPAIHRVKCIPHARPATATEPASWHAAGHVTVVVIPDLRGRYAPNPLQPRCDLDTLDRVRSFLRDASGMGVEIHVKNPTYERVHVSAELALRRGRPLTLSEREIERVLVEALTPWAFDGTSELRFGGEVHRSTILAILERHPAVDFIERLELRPCPDTADVRASADLPVVRALAPDAILVSNQTHDITARSAT